MRRFASSIGICFFWSLFCFAFHICSAWANCVQILWSAGCVLRFLWQCIIFAYARNCLIKRYQYIHNYQHSPPPLCPGAGARHRSAECRAETTWDALAAIAPSGPNHRAANRCWNRESSPRWMSRLRPECRPPS